jgi:hypothetical protein
MAITNGYTTGSAVKEALGIIDASSDTEIDLVIETVSRMIDDYAGRFFYSAGTVVSFYTPDKALSLEIDDVSSVSILQTMTVETGRLVRPGELQTMCWSRLTLRSRGDRTR